MTRFMVSREQLEEHGTAALARLICIGKGDSGQTRHVRRFLIGLYNGSTFPFDLTDLRCRSCDPRRRPRCARDGYRRAER